MCCTEFSSLDDIIKTSRENAMLPDMHMLDNQTTGNLKKNSSSVLCG
jgi:hypothetical protein